MDVHGGGNQSQQSCVVLPRLRKQFLVCTILTRKGFNFSLKKVQETARSVAQMPLKELAFNAYSVHFDIPSNATLTGFISAKLQRLVLFAMVLYSAAELQSLFVIFPNVEELVLYSNGFLQD